MLPVEVVRALGIEAGLELDGREEERFVTAIERGKAYEAAVRLLAARGRSVQEMISRLRRKGLRPDAVEHAVGRLESEGLLDDAVMAREYARSRAERGFGRARILADLSRRGVERRVAERAVAEAVGDDEAGWRETLLALARSRAPRVRGLDRDVARRRLAGYLARRGYDGADVLAAVNQVLEPDEGKAARRWNDVMP